MIYKSIEEIRSLGNFGVSNYAASLAVENDNFEVADLLCLFDTIRNEAYVDPIPDEVLIYITSYLVERYSEVSFRIYPRDMVVDSSAKIIFRWNLDENSYYMLLTSEQMNNLERSLLLADAGEVSMFTSTSEMSISNEYRAFLRLLGVPSEDEIQGVIPPIQEDQGVSERLSRFSSALWFDEINDIEVLLAGCGGIGSFAALILSRVNIQRLIVIDADTVEEGNMSGQLVRYNQVGQYKVNAVYRNIHDFSGFYNVYSYNRMYDENSPVSNVMISGFDNMAARKVFYNKWKDHVYSKSEAYRKELLLIDGRLAAEEFQVFCIRGDDTYSMKRYEEEFLFSSEEAEETICSYKQTTFMASMIGSVITNLVVNFAANKVVEGLRELPFLTTYDAASMTMKVVD